MRGGEEYAGLVVGMSSRGDRGLVPGRSGWMVTEGAAWSGTWMIPAATSGNPGDGG